MDVTTASLSSCRNPSTTISKTLAKMSLLEEMRQSLANTDEMKMWDEKKKHYSENIEQTKQMQEAIRTQLRSLIEHKIK